MSKKPTKNKQGVDIPSFIINTGKVLQTISSTLAVRFAAKLFTTPIKYKVPKRERTMLDESIKENVFIESLNKTVVTYLYGKGEKRYY